MAVLSGQPLRDLLDSDLWTDRDLITLEQLLTREDLR